MWKRVSKLTAKKALSYYIHIPFCSSKCFYCDFDSGLADYNTKETYIELLIKEMRLAYSAYELSFIDTGTVFIGGGTPSSLEEALLEKLLLAVGRYLIRGQKTEFTAECNPESINENKLKLMKAAGVNRLSFGLQSANETELKTLGRIHDYETFLRAFEMARAYGFDNINVDLMFALPHQSMESFKNTLGKVLSLDTEHISLYGLIIEPGTKMEKYYGSNKAVFPSEIIYNKMYCYAVKLLEQQGYAQYEISNFAKTGRQCRHNVVYWKSGEYIGLGRSAHSFFERKRFYNAKNDYEKLLHQDILPKSNEEYIDDRSLYNEWIMLRLRMNDGINIEHINSRFKIDFLKQNEKTLLSYIKTGHVKIEENRVFLTLKGFEISNSIMVNLMI